MKNSIYSVISVCLFLPLACLASKADEARESCAEAIAIEVERSTQSESRMLDVNMVCANTEHTADTWECVVDSMKSNEYSMAQAMNDCSCKK